MTVQVTLGTPIKFLTSPSPEMLAHIRSAYVIAPILLALTTKENPGFVYAYEQTHEGGVEPTKILLPFGENSGDKFWKRCLVVNDKLRRTFATSPLSHDTRDPDKPTYGQPEELAPIGQWGGGAYIGIGIRGGISGLTEAEDEAGTLAISANASGIWRFPHLRIRTLVESLLYEIQKRIPTT